METWKLAAIMAASIFLAVIGGISLELRPSQAVHKEVDLGFEAPSANPAPLEAKG